MEWLNSGNELQQQRKLAIFIISIRLPSFLSSFVAAIASGSAVVWLEFLESASILIPGIILAVLSRKLNRNLKYVFNYGTGKVEAITALSCELFDIAGLLCICLFSVGQLISPSEESSYLLLALFFSVAGVLIDFFIVTMQKRILDGNSSKMFHTAYISAQKEFLFDGAAILTLVISIIFAGTEWVRYLSPIVCIVISIPFFCIVYEHVKTSVAELIDRTLDEKSQLRIVKVLNEFYESYDELGEVRSRINGEERFVDIELRFKDEMNYSSIEKVARSISQRVQEELGPSTVNIVLLQK